MSIKASAGHDPSHKKQENTVGNNNNDNDLGLTKEEEELYAQLLAKKKASADAGNKRKKKVFQDVIEAGRDYQVDSECLVGNSFASLPEGSIIDSRHMVTDNDVLSWHYIAIKGQSTGVGIFTSGKVESVIGSNRTALESPLKGNQGRKATS